MNKETVLITGSSTGLGESLALVFARSGYDIILHGRNRSNLERVGKKLSDIGSDFSVVEGDLMSKETLTALERTAVERNASILINNAAAILDAYGIPFEEIDDEKIEKVFTTNLTALVKLTRRLYQIFLKNKSGTIINLNSLVGLEIKESNILYGASKWGLRGFTNALALEAKKKNVRVIGVYLSRVKTRQEFIYGMEPEDTAQKIYAFYKDGDGTELILDERPEEYKPTRYL